jgi:hypothetical protein
MRLQDMDQVEGLVVCGWWLVVSGVVCASGERLRSGNDCDRNTLHSPLTANHKPPITNYAPIAVPFLH